MTYQASENSTAGGHPLELYQFSYGTTTLLYTSGDESYTDAAFNVYLPAPIRRSGFDVNSSGKIGNLALTVPRDQRVAALFRAFVPGRRIGLTLRRVHLTDPDLEEVVLWKGSVREVTWKNSQATITCDPLDALLDREGLRRHYQSTCPHMHYGKACGLLKELYQTLVDASGVVVADDTLTAAEFGTKADDWFTNGWITRNNLDFRLIVAHTGTQVTLLQPFEDLDPADSLVAYAGCDRLQSTCIGKFNNNDNYGGYLFIPRTNPFETGLET